MSSCGVWRSTLWLIGGCCIGAFGFVCACVGVTALSRLLAAMGTPFVSGSARVACCVVLSAICALLILIDEDKIGYVLGACCTMVTHPLATPTLVRLLALGMLLTWLDYWSGYVQDANARGATSCATAWQVGPRLLR